MIHVAAFNGDLEEVKRQVETKAAKPSEPDSRKQPCVSVSFPAHYAAAGGHVDVLKYLVACGVDLTKEREKPSHCTPAHIAAMNGRASCLKWMLDNDHIDINVADGNGVTPLMVAAAYGRLKVAQALLDHGGGSACLLDVKRDKKGKETALTMAVQNKNWDIATLLLQRGADPRPVASLVYAHAGCAVKAAPAALLELVQRSLAEASRFRVLYKARALGDAAYAVQHKALSLRAPDTPVWYRKRVLRDLALPRLAVGKGESDVLHDTIAFVVGVDTASAPASGTLAPALVQELMGYMAPAWVPERRPLGPL